MPLTLSDAVAADLADLLAVSMPPALQLPGGAIRLRHDTRELPATSLVVRSGDAEMVADMDGTGTMEVEIVLTSRMDGMEPERHRAMAGLIGDWLRGVRTSKRRTVIQSRAFLHNMEMGQPAAEIDGEQREQRSVLRARVTATLVA
jgi:hypothetical protein